MSKELEKEMQDFLDKDSLQREMEGFSKSEDLLKNKRENNLNSVRSQFPTDYESIKKQSESLIRPYESLMAKYGTVPISAVRSLTTMSTDPLMAELTSQVPTEEGSFRKDLGPVAGTITDMAVSGSIGAGLNKLAPMLQEASIENASKSLVESAPSKDIQRTLMENPGTVYDPSVHTEGIPKAAKTGAQKIAETADKYNLIPYLTDKSKMLRKLYGDRYKGARISKGLIQEEAENLSSELKKVSQNQGETLGSEDLIQKISRKVKDEIVKESASPTSGIEFDEDSIKKIDKIVNRFIKPKKVPYGDPNVSDELISMASEQMNPRANELIKLKRSAQKYAYESGKAISLDPKSAGEDKAIYDKIWKIIDDEIYEMARQADPDSANKIRELNNNLSDLFSLENVIKDASIAGKGSVLENVVGAGITGATAAGLTGNPAYAATGAIFPLARRMGSEAMGGLTSSIGATQANVANAIKGSFVNPSSLASVSAEMSLNSFQVPMSTSGASQNKDMVYAKILRDFGPQQAELFKTARSVDQVRALFRTLQQQNPGSFEQSKYNSIDGYVDPAFKQQAASDIAKDKGSPAVNADRMERLLHDGYIGE